ncbi:hypothetical protein O3Q52_01675 [Streptomyces sp. ActVer]|uniref:hypothetical protein n=1 Tax=Streptomyces sp. ActVer TaxID=3014558 RepID=UPI0022B44AEB|nr:hypothetical protein [Streptomyces sp. ActVer]MCZ4506937.1 hypothetical protein [Streptomyces sp. ActVer]
MTDPVLERLKGEGSVIDIYAVGALSDLSFFVHSIDRPAARRKLRYAAKGMLDRARRREWRALRSYFNGYLAEHPTLGSRAGHGWTRGRAARDLARHLILEERLKEVTRLIDGLKKP